MPVPDGYVVEPNTKKLYTPMPEDKYQVMIFDVNPIQELSFKGDSMVDKLDFSFVVLDDKKFKSKNEEGEEVEESTRGRRLWRKIPRSFSPGGKYKASLFYELMCAVERRDIPKEELAAVDPNTLIGQQLCVFVSINDQWNNIDSFLKADTDMEALPTVYDLDEETKKETPKTKNGKQIEELSDKEKEEVSKELPF